MKLTMWRGDSAVFNIACKEADGSPLDITSGELWFTAKSNSRVPDNAAVFQKDTMTNGITVTNGAQGLATIMLSPSDTADVYAPTTLVWDLQYATSGGLVFTLMAGELLVKADVTSSAYIP